MEDAWRKNLNSVLMDRFGSLRAASLKISANQTYFRDIIKKGSSPSAEKLPEIADLLGLSVDELLNLGGSRLHVVRDQEAYSGKLPGAIPEIDAEAGAGDGIVGEIVNFDGYSAHVVNAEWVVPRDVLGVDERRVHILTVRGDSMFPTLSPGDRVMFDARSVGIRHGEIYVLDEGDGPIVKRARILRDEDPVQIEIISDNPAVQPMRRPAHLVRILGRVIGRYSKL